jgi:hypothetical protein
MARAETLTPSLDSCAQTTWQRSVSRRGSFDGRIASAERWKAAVAAQSARCSEQRVSFPRHFKVLTGGLDHWRTTPQRWEPSRLEEAWRTCAASWVGEESWCCARKIRRKDHEQRRRHELNSRGAIKFHAMGPLACSRSSIFGVGSVVGWRRFAVGKSTGTRAMRCRGELRAASLPGEDQRHGKNLRLV